MASGKGAPVSEETKKRLIVGITGASGAVLGVELLRALRLHPDWESHLVISEGGVRTITYETPYSVAEVAALATQTHPLDDIGASIASGSFKAEGMVVAPCSMKTLAAIAGGYAQNLLLRAADVTIKERRKLVLVARESPLSPIHLHNMNAVANCGAVILPPMLTFYNHPRDIGDMVRHIVGKILDVFDIEMAGFKRWDGTERDLPAGEAETDEVKR
jgi:polyprenyl P-hydroxybenzoate/phenylacrylic acid decarboxylase-like protein